MPSFAISFTGFGIPEQTQLLVYIMRCFQEGLTKERSPSLSLRGSIQEGGRGQSYLKTCIFPSLLPACGHMVTSCHMAQKSLCHYHPFPAMVDRSPKELSFLSWVLTVMRTGTNCQWTEKFDKGWRTWLLNIKPNSKITPSVNRFSAQTCPRSTTKCYTCIQPACLELWSPHPPAHLWTCYEKRLPKCWCRQSSEHMLRFDTRRHQCTPRYESSKISQTTA